MGLEPYLLSRKQGLRLVSAVLRRCGVRPADAVIVARVLIEADQRGVPGHGIARLGQYVLRLESGAVNPRPNVDVLSSGRAIELWDADSGLGHPVTWRATIRAARLARRFGLGGVAIRDSSHFGIAGAYARLATQRRVIALVLSNATATVAPTGTTVPMLGTNPLAIGVPAKQASPFVLDMATSVRASGALEVAAREGGAIPVGWAIDANGNDTTDPETALNGAHLPLGGRATTAGYKGYGLAAAVDLLAGVLTGSGSLANVRGIRDLVGRSNVGHLVVAIDPAVFGSADAFLMRVDAWKSSLRGAALAGGEVIIAGERGDAMVASDPEHVLVDPKTLAMLRDLVVRRRLLGFAPFLAATDARLAVH